MFKALFIMFYRPPKYHAHPCNLLQGLVVPPRQVALHLRGGDQVVLRGVRQPSLEERGGGTNLRRLQHWVHRAHRLGVWAARDYFRQLRLRRHERGHRQNDLNPVQIGLIPPNVAGQIAFD